MSGSWEASCDRSSFPEGLSPEAFRSGERSIAQPVDFRGEQPEKIRADQPVA